MPNDVPDCFCPGDDCEYCVEVTARYYNKNNPDAVTSEVPWKLENIPQPLAQAILQASVKAVNEHGAATYLKWLEACAAGDDMVETAKRVLSTVDWQTED